MSQKVADPRGGPVVAESMVASFNVVPAPGREERVMKPRRAAPADAVRPTRAEVNLGNVRHNLHVLKKATSSAILGVLKADGYGHGAPAIARTLERAGIDGFSVALLEEGIELRDAGITRPILVMGGYYGSSFDELLAARLTPVVYDIGHLEGIARAVRLANADPVSVHLKVDTGMARLGVRPHELPAMLEALRRFPEVSLRGLMTHFACADDASGEAVAEQLAIFEDATAVVRAAGFNPTMRHAANSAALLKSPSAELDAVRPGVALFGVAPFAEHTDLRPVMRVRSEIVSLRTIEAGEAVGYGWTFRATKQTRVATVPVGYADGLPRALSNRGALLVRGKRTPIIGAVSMDMTMVDVTDHPGVTIRDEAVVLGAQQGVLGKDVITAEEIATHAGTIAWEVMTNISRRVPRFYREPLSLADPGDWPDCMGRSGPPKQGPPW